MSVDRQKHHPHFHAIDCHREECLYHRRHPNRLRRRSSRHSRRLEFGPKKFRYRFDTIRRGPPTPRDLAAIHLSVRQEHPNLDPRPSQLAGSTIVATLEVRTHFCLDVASLNLEIPYRFNAQGLRLSQREGTIFPN